MNCCNNKGNMGEYNRKPNVNKEVGDRKLICVKCGMIKDIPHHCHQPMIQVGNQLVCWMGSHCGRQSIPLHCGQPMVID